MEAEAAVPDGADDEAEEVLGSIEGRQKGYSNGELQSVLDNADESLRGGESGSPVTPRWSVTQLTLPTTRHTLSMPPDAILCHPAMSLTSHQALIAALAEDYSNLDGLLGSLEDVVQCLQLGLLTAEQTHHVTYQAMPKLVLMLLKLRCSSTDVQQRLNNFFRTILRASVVLLQSGEIWELVECATRVLTDGVSYNRVHVYSRPSASDGPQSPGGMDDLDSNSSGEGSASEASDQGDAAGDTGHGIISTKIDDVSPYYVQNIEYFYQLGGFRACLERITREPHVPLSGVRLLLRPFIKVPEPRFQATCPNVAP